MWPQARLACLNILTCAFVSWKSIQLPVTCLQAKTARTMGCFPGKNEKLNQVNLFCTQAFGMP